MIKRIALFVLAKAVNAYEQKGHSADLIDETRLQFCMYNDFENKETQSIDLGFEGFVNRFEPNARLLI